MRHGVRLRFVYLLDHLSLVDAFLIPISHWTDKDGLRRFVERSSGPDLLRDIRPR